MKKPLIFLFGPTASGKSDLSVLIAESINAEIGNMDSAQWYTPLTIGTAKPSFASMTVPHHLFDCIDTPETLTVVTYRAMVLQLYKKLSDKNKRLVLVGGSGFYLKSLLFPPVDTSQAVTDQTKNHDFTISWDHLNTIDPDRAAQIKPNDLYRIQRALEIWYSSGIKPSLMHPTYNPVAPYHIIYVTRERDDLYNRINQRVLHMIDQGFLEEVAALLNTPWESFLLDKKFIGYNELIEYLRGPRTPHLLQIALARIQQRSRNYAKRQETFWRMLKKDMIKKEKEMGLASPLFTELNLTHLRDDLYIRELVKRISQF